MAKQRDVRLKIEIDGEEEYKRAIQNINNDNRLLNAELKQLAEAYKNDADNMGYLVQKGEKLQSQLIENEAKVTLLRSALKEATAQLGGDNDATREWAIQLANAETALSRTKNAIDANNQAMQSASGTLVGLGDQIDELTGAFGIHVPEAAKGALNEMASFSSGTVAVMAEAAGGIAAVYEVGKKLYDLTAEAAAAADALLTRSAQTGLSTDLLQQLDYAQNFLDFEGIDQSLSKLTQSMGKATTEGSAQAEAFRKLGVEIYNEDGKLRNNYDVFLDVIDALGTMDDKTRADILANQLFGRSYTDLKPLIDAGSSALKTYTDRAAEMGYVIDEQIIKRLGRFDDAIQENKTAVETAKTELAGFFAPIFQDLTEAGTGAINGLRQLFSSDAFQFAEGLVNPVFSLLSLWSDASAAADEYNENQALLVEVLQGVVEQAEAAAEATNELNAAQAQTTELTPEAAEAIQSATAAMDEAVTALALRYDEALSSAKASLEGQFGLWQEASLEVEHSIDDMIRAQESQEAYWATYADNLEALQNRNIEGVDALAERFSDGSQQSAEALAALSQASDEEISALIESMDKTDQARTDLATRFADMQVNVTGELEKIKTEFDGTVADINSAAGELDFEPFETSVSGAFSFLEDRASTTVSTVRGWLAELSAEIDAVASAPRARISGHNAGGTDNWRGGLTWVGESGPELVSLPRGTAIHSAQESRQLAAAPQDNRRVEALLERNVALLERISGEFSGLRVKGRMAM